VDLSIIIVNWNACKVLHDCLASIRNSHGDLETEVFVVDNDSTDGSGEMVERDFPEVHLINSGSNMGFGRANNLAIPQAKAPYVFFLNPDTIVKQNALEKMFAFLDKNPETGLIGCKMIDAEGYPAELPLQMEATPLKRLLIQIFFTNKSANIIERVFPSHNPLESGYLKNLYGACLMIRKKVLDEVGCFDEQFFMYAEDVDLCQRIYKKGWKIYYMSEVEIIHLEGKASESAPKDFSISMMCESISKLMSKNYGTKGRIIYRFGVFTSSCLRLIVISSLVGMDYVRGIKTKLKHKHSMRKYLIMLKWSLTPLKK
jgi:GT2 family glycosyltransferase